MARQQRIYFQNAVYHITIRGNNRQNIIKEDRDKEIFLGCVLKFKLRFKNRDSDYFSVLKNKNGVRFIFRWKKIRTVSF